MKTTTTKKAETGKGIAALLSDATPGTEFKNVPLKEIKPDPNQPRKFFDESKMQELIDSIRAKGVIQPILLRPKNKGLMLVCGERRFRASCAVQGAIKTRDSIPAVIRDLSDEEALELQLIENIQRENPHPMEEAVAFKSLLILKKGDIKEVALLVGKGAGYIGQRLKLNELIPEIQEAFFTNKISISDAVKIARLLKVDQQDLYKCEIKKSTVAYILSAYDIQKYTHNLTDPPFDTKDTTLRKDLIACTVCPQNSASNTLLFPDQVTNPICSNAQCFKLKCTLSFGRELKNSEEDPAVVLISMERYGESDELKKLKTKHEKIYNYHSFEEADRPDFPDRTDFDNDNDTAEEDELDFQKAVSDFHEDMDKFNKRVATGGYIKAFIVAGDNKGKYTFVKLKKQTSASSAASSKNGTTNAVTPAKVTKQDVKNEIARIQDREKRAKGLDGEKVWTEIRELLKKPEIRKKLYHNKMLNKLEYKAMVDAMYSKMDYSTRDKIKEILGCLPGSKEIGELEFTSVCRMFMLNVLISSFGSHVKAGSHNQVAYNVMRQYLPTELTTIEHAQAEVADRRGGRVTGRIASLKKQLTVKPLEAK